MSDDWDSEDLEEVVYCPRHPKIEATLRCYQCGQPICIKCARRTPVGYICPDCLHGRKANFEQATRRDLISASLVALVLGLLASALFEFFGMVCFVSFPPCRPGDCRGGLESRPAALQFAPEMGSSRCAGTSAPCHSWSSL